MTIFPFNIAHSQELISLNFLRRKRYHASDELAQLSDRSLEDIGLKSTGHDFDAVKPFWMP